RSHGAGVLVGDFGADELPANGQPVFAVPGQGPGRFAVQDRVAYFRRAQVLDEIGAGRSPAVGGAFAGFLREAELGIQIRKAALVGQRPVVAVMVAITQVAIILGGDLG